MPAEIIHGSAIGEAIVAELHDAVRELTAKHGRPPGLVTLLVGDNPASQSYVRLKIKRARELGFHEVQDTRPADLTQAELLELVARYNADRAIDGILVQLPLPKHIDERKVIAAIHPDKDVDGFTPVNQGRLVIDGPAAPFPPCTPAGIVELLVRSGVETRGAEVVVVGRSNIVGKPLALLMMQKGRGGDAVVTVLHTGASREAMERHCRRADILVAAAGVPGLVPAAFIKPGATVIDVGVNRVGTTDGGKAILRGDVDFEAACEVAGRITPVPGGVGPMTIAMLMRNTVRAARLALGENGRE